MTGIIALPLIMILINSLVSYRLYKKSVLDKGNKLNRQKISTEIVKGVNNTPDKEAHGLFNLENSLKKQGLEFNCNLKNYMY